jgi:hypothetical protein
VNGLEKAYNIRSTRPIWHWWRPADDDTGIRRALCGAKAHDDLLDANTGHLRGCGNCDAKERAQGQPQGGGK